MGASEDTPWWGFNVPSMVVSPLGASMGSTLWGRITGTLAEVIPCWGLYEWAMWGPLQGRLWGGFRSGGGHTTYGKEDM